VFPTLDRDNQQQQPHPKDRRHPLARPYRNHEEAMAWPPSRAGTWPVDSQIAALASLDSANCSQTAARLQQAKRLQSGPLFRRWQNEKNVTTRHMRQMSRHNHNSCTDIAPSLRSLRSYVLTTNQQTDFRAAECITQHPNQRLESFRSPKRITITVPYQIYQNLTERSDREGRSLSNLAAFLLEQSCRNQLDASQH
jgi:hypothetical protein